MTLSRVFVLPVTSIRSTVTGLPRSTWKVTLTSFSVRVESVCGLDVSEGEAALGEPLGQPLDVVAQGGRR